MNWTLEEVQAVIADYFAMLGKELRGEIYSKAAHRRALSPMLNDRSDASIEFKHQNISAILIELGFPYVEGYKPARNYQKLLMEVVAERLESSRVLIETVRESVLQSPVTPELGDILRRSEEPPEREERHVPAVREGPSFKTRVPVNHLELEARNASLGRAGEEFVLAFERARLIRIDRGNLADRVEHVSVTEGDGAGFDVRSFEADGTDRFIEVKTTKYGKHTPFFVTRNEVKFSRFEERRYQLYRVFRYASDPRLYQVPGAIEHGFALDPAVYEARR